MVSARLTVRNLDIIAPSIALCSLAEVLAFGVSKHGRFVPADFTPEHFLAKHGRHMVKHLAGRPIDESGHPHLIHAAADLLLAWECHTTKEET